ncbi:DUF3303 domain-containing protein [Orrella marina]|uniref:Muconolactone isomerase domain-containing protein n=1 Tax=Orrella marina TaxID=2163011 RepID=A0A2R4XI76_9BURK|nr:DUF3303 family protein [Orrella marina]AWB33532.1 hypothetical protein DBV39_07205 [Orrella marina]
MLFLVISNPRPERPSDVAGSRRHFWAWVQPLLDAGHCRSVHARVGRGVVAMFDVDSHLTLHRYLNEWADMIPAEFDVYPLLDADQAKGHLQSLQSGQIQT